MHADRMHVVLRFFEEAGALQVLQHFLARVESIESFGFGARGVGHVAGFVDHLHLRQVVAQSRFVVVLVVRWCDFHDARSEFGIDEDGVGDDWDATIRDRQ